MQNLNGYTWTKIEMNKSQLESQVKMMDEVLSSGNNVSDVFKMNHHAYKMELTWAINHQFGLNDTCEFEIITKK